MMAAGLAALTLSGCASNDPAPLEQMRLTEQALEQAKAVGATDDVAELKLAQDKYAAAQIAMTAESYKKARLLAEQAELDARLAESKVLTQKSKDQLGELDKSLKRLRKQLGGDRLMPGKATLFATLLACAALAGCADHKLSEQSLAKAQSEFDQVKEDSDVLRAAPKDVIRAGESLARAERLSSYWGSSSDVIQYAYLSQRYSEIARQHALLNLNQERLTRLQLERERLQLALREAKLLSVQEQGQRLSEEIASLSTEETERGLVLTLGDVLFDFNRAELKPAANRTALKLVQFLQLNPRRVIRIEGYTDSVGDRQANLDLSRERAQAVADVLADLGVDPARMQVVGYGEAFPVTDNASNRGRAQNRRVEIVFSNDKGQLSAPR
ncbi:outer membrane protein [Pseudomonas aeruginosa]|nr:outer membrane protein [Pseudomonas aeruginosa]